MVNVQVHSDLLKTEDETKVYINNLCPKFLSLLLQQQEELVTSPGRTQVA
jgi:hypothetical protein